ncbi:unnamed protein product [Urochloa humidicola]
MFTIRDFLGLFIGAAVTAACFVLLDPPAQCPWGVLPAEHQELDLGNATTQAADLSTNRLDTAATSTLAEDDKQLERLLTAAVMADNKTVIMTFTNKAWTAPGSLQDLFLESFRVGDGTTPLLNHLIIIAVDANAYEACQRVHPLCYHLRDSSAAYTSEQVYMAKGYLEMMWRRNRFQVRVLQLGYSFVFTDMDIIWLRNPLLRVPIGADLVMSCDAYRHGEDRPYDLDRKAANSGFIYVRASDRMLEFYESWYAARVKYPGTNEQYVFDREKYVLPGRHGLLVQFVDTAYLSGFCELSKDFNKVCTVHANCLVGLKDKLEKLTEVLAEWKQFRANTTGQLTG